MRLNQLWTKPPLSIILAVHLFPWTIYTQEEDCVTEIRVRRNTVHKASPGQDLKLECPVHFCNDSQPVVSWCKLDDSNGCRPLNEFANDTCWNVQTYHKGIASLNLKDVSTNDTGQYRCQYRSAMSHNIRVRVSEKAENSTVHEKNEATISPPTGLDWLLPYIYSAVGISGLVVVVISTSILLMRRTQGRPKNTNPTENKYLAIPMTQQASGHADVSPRPHRGASPKPIHAIYDNAPSRRPPRTPAHSAANLKAAPEDGHQGNRKTGKRARDDEGLVYAALDHNAFPGAPGRPQRPREEFSEYAAIRLHCTPGQHNNMLSL